MMPRRPNLPVFLLAAALVSGCALTAPDNLVPSEAPPTASAQDRNQAERLYRDGLRSLNPPAGQAADPDRGAALVQSAATLGDPEAQMLVAGSHLFRSDGSRDPAAAIPWLHRAAHQGLPEAQYRLARLIEAGDGTRREPAWAAVWFQRAAERGNAEAQFAMALLQVAGEGTAQDQAEALGRLAIADRQGVSAARRYLDALRARVPPAEARRAISRISGEVARGPVRPVDRPLARFAQSALVTCGSWPRPVDGLDGPQTRAALAAFARQQGLPAAAPYDAAVIDRLRACVLPR